ncbi:TonB-dependent receptor [Catenovulum sp. SM1970]|uniref:TonB-dependent receptor n=1 Tax=Marinifaba aquimaris TaxID=2741323 RepID=UPI0015744F5E|nr:TonB-dependent receptor [Marinifaba aquimaris]NTS76097.1 TonB-dependent receptor [Marinifaba aquimaris]
MKKTLLSVAIASSFSSIPSFAQANEGEELEVISITGSRINRADMETASPVTVISAGDIAAQGYTSVEAILSDQPAIAGINLGSNSNNGSGGSATVNLRGMGEQRTLVLLNGRRMVASGIGADSSVDLNTIPVGMIQSIEILKDGASAVYGSDAIAGVVNIITKKDYEGTEINLTGGMSGEGDGETLGLSILHGLDGDDYNLVLGASYDERKEVKQGDRDYIPEGCSSFIPEGSLDGWVPDGNGGFKERDSCYDYAAESLAQTPNEIYNVFSALQMDLGSDVYWDTDIMYTFRKSNQEMAPQPAAIDLSVCQSYEQGNCLDMGDVLIPELDELEYKRRMTDAGNRIYQQETETYRISSELNGELASGDTWNASITYAKNESKDWVHNSINAVKMEQSIYEHQQEWLSGQPLSDEIIDDVTYLEHNEGGNEQFVIALGYAGETDSEIGYAVGVESRYEEGYYTPDQVVQDGESTAAQQDPTSGDYHVKSIYGEVAVPVTDAWNIEGAVRYDHYSTFGGEATWKLGTTYEINDNWMLRGVAATGYRAPNVSELYGGNTGSYDYLSDPWGRTEDAQILVFYTSDPDLQPEKSKSLTAGIVWDATDNLSATIDYWSFDVDDAIARVDVQNELNKCFSGDLSACELINVSPDGDLDNLTASLTNVGNQKTSGLDLNVQYKFDAFGRASRFSFDTTYLLEFEEDGVDYTGTIGGMTGAYAELKANAMLQSNITDNFDLTYQAQYIQGMDGEYYGETFSTSSVVYHNMSDTYTLSDQMTLTAGINNLFDKEPEEVMGGNDMGTVPEVYDVIGRTFFAGLNYKF